MWLGLDLVIMGLGLGARGLGARGVDGLGLDLRGLGRLDRSHVQWRRLDRVDRFDLGWFGLGRVDRLDAGLGRDRHDLRGCFLGASRELDPGGDRDRRDPDADRDVDRHPAGPRIERQGRGRLGRDVILLAASQRHGDDRAHGRCLWWGVDRVARVADRRRKRPRMVGASRDRPRGQRGLW